MGKYQDISIKALINEINSKYFLPEIQRPFVWKNNKNEFEEKVFSLFDSILRGFPIGTFLFWCVDKERIESDNLDLLNFLTVSNENNEKLHSISPDKDYILVLDGQQRITILNLVFNGVFRDQNKKTIRNRNLYFNLLTNFENDSDTNQQYYEFKFFDESNGEFYLDNESIWIKVKEIINISSLAETRKKILKNYPQFSDDETVIEKNLETIKNSINESNLSFYQINKQTQDDEALEIFVRVNSKGVVLSYSDLLFSKIKHYWNKEDKESARTIFESFLNGDTNKDEIQGINRYGEGFNFSNDFILKTSLVLLDKEVKYRLKNFNDENISILKKEWNNISKSIQKVIKFLPNIGITSSKFLRSANTLIPVIYHVYKNSLFTYDLEENTFPNKYSYAQFIYVCLLNRIFGGQSDQALKESRTVIQNNKSGLFPLSDLLQSLAKKRTIVQNEFIGELLDDVVYKTDRSRIVFKILFRNNVDDESQEDHIFPKTKLKGKYENDIYNSIYNLQPLKIANQLKGKTDFESWFTSIIPIYPDYCKDYLIPELDNELTSYSINNFETFIAKRKALMIKKLDDYFSCVLKSKK